MSNQIDFKALAAEAAELEDQTEVKSGGNFEAQEIPAGPAVARLVEYIELGKQPRKAFQGKAKEPADEVRLTFELLGSNHVREIEVDGVKKQIANRISFTVNKILNDKAGFKKLFDKMTYGRDSIKNMAQMLGGAFLVTVVHNVVGEGDKARTYYNLKSDDGTWTIGAPVVAETDASGLPTGKTKPIKAPEPVGPMRMFIWNKPTRATWDSLHIDGEYETKDDKGNKVVKSKNFIQDKIKSAVNFAGSPLFQLLSGMDSLPEIQEAEQESEKKTTKKSSKKTTTAPTAEQTDTQDAAVAAEDPMAALGLA